MSGWSRICFASYDRGFALVAERLNPETADSAKFLAWGVSARSVAAEAEAAVLVSDQWQGRGLGTELLASVARMAREEKFQRLSGEILRDNLATQAIFKKTGFRMRSTEIHPRYSRTSISSPCAQLMGATFRLQAGARTSPWGPARAKPGTTSRRVLALR